MAIHSIDDVRRANAAKGQHWFDAASMRFFNSRVGDWTLPLDSGGCLFVSSEQQPRTRNPRLYSVRLCSPDGDISTVGTFQGYATGAQAKGAAKRIAEVMNKGG